MDKTKFEEIMHLAILIITNSAELLGKPSDPNWNRVRLKKAGDQLYMILQTL
jgi:hypothetical protein